MNVNYLLNTVSQTALNYGERLVGTLQKNKIAIVAFLAVGCLTAYFCKRMNSHQLTKRAAKTPQPNHKDGTASIPIAKTRDVFRQAISREEKHIENEWVMIRENEEENKKEDVKDAYDVFADRKAQDVRPNEATDHPLINLSVQELLSTSPSPVLSPKEVETGILSDPRLNPIDQSLQWGFKEDQIAAVVSLYEKSIVQKNDQLQAECDDYFQKAFFTPGQHMVDFFQAAKKQPGVVQCLLDAAIKAWVAADQNKPIIEHHLQEIINELPGNEEDDLDFILPFLEKMEMRQQEDSRLTMLTRRVFGSYSLHQIGELVRFIIKRANKPEMLLNYLSGQKIFGDDLQKLINAIADDKKFLSELSADQLKALIQQWKTCLSKLDLFVKLGHILRNRNDLEQVEQLVDVCVNLAIDLDEFIFNTDKTIRTDHFCKAYVVHILKSSEPESIKTLKIADAIQKLCVWPGDHRQLGVYLALKCPTEHLSFLMTALPNLGTTHHDIGIGLLEGLLFDRSTASDRVQKAFEGFWKCWKQFDIGYYPGLAQELLLAIQSEEHLRAIVYAISPSADDRKVILTLLRGEHPDSNFGQARILKLNLPRDVIDRIVV